MLWSAICHCESCRRVAGADQVSWFGVARDALRWEGERTLTSRSAGTERSHCPACGTPMNYRADHWPEEVHLYAVSLDDPTLYTPTAHVH
jgi:hypothetical protein